MEIKKKTFDDLKGRIDSELQKSNNINNGYDSK
ncbi:hypothetical protein QOZ91_000719 [Clostridium sardiniense]|nr:hypothetical protein [Clostridium sardiniense]